LTHHHEMIDETVKAIADYVGQQYTHGGDIQYMKENLNKYIFVQPENLDDDNDYWKRRGIYSNNKMKLFSLIWGQSTKTTQSKLQTHQDFQEYKNSL